MQLSHHALVLFVEIQLRPYATHNDVLGRFRFSREFFLKRPIFAKFSSLIFQTPKCKKRPEQKRPEFCVLKANFGTLLIFSERFSKRHSLLSHNLLRRKSLFLCQIFTYDGAHQCATIGPDDARECIRVVGELVHDLLCC
jgi:hypothetical protein